MPTYQFRCPDGSIVERVYRISEVPDRIPNPGGDGEAVRIISGGAGLIFKGSGFYITDYGKDGKKDQRDASRKAESAKEPATSSPNGGTKPSEPAGGAGSATSSGSSGGGSPPPSGGDE